MSFQRFIAILTAAMVLAFSALSARTGEANDVRFFETKIRPVLVKHCYECHSGESGKARGGLKVDSMEAIRRGGDSGAGIIPRSIGKSLVYQSITYQHADYEMPPRGKLPQNVIDDFREWIESGAADPRGKSIAPNVETEIDFEAGRDHWAYHPLDIAQQGMPEVSQSSWAKTVIDQYVANRIDNAGLKIVGDATDQRLIRRLFLVITGLPPTPQELNNWTTRMASADSGDESLGRFEGRREAVTQLVDELLDSPRYGERWGRHWMDVARYAESTGGDQNNLYQHAWRYRDYVIGAFNEDVPFDDFIRQQIAGDLLPIASDEEWANNVIATGFLAIGTKNVGQEDQQQFFADLVDEQLDTTTRAFLATTVACARCHDHKFDPIAQEEYYAMAGIFRSTATHYGLLKAQARQATTLLDLTGLGPPAGTATLDQSEYAALVARRDQAADAVEQAMAKIRSGENVFRGTLRRLRSQRDETEAALKAYGPSGQPRVFAMGVQDRDHVLSTRLLVRGELDKPAQLVSRGVPQVLAPPRKNMLPSNTRGSGRLQLANWIAWEQNPLTARVMANRIWHWMFGRGIVRTVDDFGQSGSKPTYPALLDHLARRLVQNNWSIKSVVREIALSRTWQLDSRFDRRNFDIDPDADLLWRFNPRRMEAEAIRDSMLATAGNLDLQRPVGTYLADAGEGNVGQNVFEPVIRAIDADTRSVYLPRVRSVLPDVIELFDAPDASLISGARQTTVNPMQALYLMNSPFVTEQADAIAERTSQLPPRQRVETLYRLLFSRPPMSDELDIGETLLRANPERGADYCQALLCSTEFQLIE